MIFPAFFVLDMNAMFLPGEAATLFSARTTDGQLPV
jgi:hypothetical protein